MSLSEKQQQFAILVAKLILWADEQGYAVTFGEAYRTPEQAALNAKKGSGIANSLHTQRLAIDLNLFKNGRYLSDSEDHKPLGDYWKSLGPECCWGGDFKPSADGNHYSISHEGRK
jgi:hypothetical protein